MLNDTKDRSRSDMRPTIVLEFATAEDRLAFTEALILAKGNPGAINSKRAVENLRRFTSWGLGGEATGKATPELSGAFKQSKLPGVLGKAVDDPCWAYACELKSGRRYAFDGIDDLGDGWIRLHAYTAYYNDVRDLAGLHDDQIVAVPERGLTVPLSEVRWAAEVRG